jgi:hypothetical protein
VYIRCAQLYSQCAQIKKKEHYIKKNKKRKEVKMMYWMIFCWCICLTNSMCTDTEVIYHIENVTGRDVAYIQRWASTLDKGSTNQSNQLVHINSFCIFCNCHFFSVLFFAYVTLGSEVTLFQCNIEFTL